jgi:hypothetical protein
MELKKFNQELDTLYNLCLAVTNAYERVLDIEGMPNYEELVVAATRDLYSKIEDFQKHCFKITPEVKRRSKEDPSYLELLEKLKETINLLSV